MKHGEARAFTICLSSHEKHVIWHALGVAADRFDIDAASAAEIPGGARLKEQFERQATETRALMEDFEP